MAETDSSMAKNPVKGNVDHENEGKHGCWSASVARMTPRAKTLVATKRLPSVQRCFLMSKMATNLRKNAAKSSRHSSNSAPPQLEFVIDSRRFWKKDDEASNWKKAPSQEFRK